MDWDAVPVFLAVARTGRVSAAARQLGVEHTTVGRRLAALEQQLGAPLFYRTARGYLLTPPGEAALADAEAMERAALALGSRARAGAGGEAVSGRVRVALLPELATHWLAPALPALRERHPAIELQLVVGIQPLDLARGEADLAIRSPRPRQQGLAAVKLATTAFGLYASTALLGRRRPRIRDAKRARGLPLLIYAQPYHDLQSAAWFQPVVAAGAIALTSNSSDTLLAAARAGAGCAVLPRFMARRYRDLISVSDDVHSGDMWLVTHPEFRRDPKVKAVSAFLRELGRELC